MGKVGEEKRTKIGKIEERSNLSPCGVRGGGERTPPHAGRRWPPTPPPPRACSAAQIRSIKACTQKRALWMKKNRAENLNTRTLLAKIMQLGVTLLAFAYDSQGYGENISEKSSNFEMWKQKP